MMKNTAGHYNVIIQIYEKEYFSFMYMADYPFKMNEFCCHWALFLWQLQHVMNMGCLSNTVDMATFIRLLLRITTNLIDKICYYASRMNEPSLNGSKRLWFLTLFKCILVNLLQNVVRSLLSVGGPNKVIYVLFIRKFCLSVLDLHLLSSLFFACCTKLICSKKN